MFTFGDVLKHKKDRASDHRRITNKTYLKVRGLAMAAELGEGYHPLIESINALIDKGMKPMVAAIIVWERESR